MHERDLGQLALFIGALLLVTPPLGAFMARLFGGQRHFLQPVLGWLESAIYKVAGVDAQREMSWKTYAAALLVFNLVGALALLVIELTQHGCRLIRSTWRTCRSRSRSTPRSAS